jgi:DNA-binding LacI/PurR family transcriptional regulator
MKNRMTIADIARNLKLDYSTVLRILNKDFQKHKYNPQTVKRVVEYAAKHNLVKNNVASALKVGRSHLVGMLVPDLSTSLFFAELASLISRKLLEHGYKVIISDTMDNPKQELKNVKDFLAYQVDGLVLSPFTRLSMLNKLIKTTPIVVVDNDLYPEFDFVGLDNTHAAEVLIRKMADAGVKKIGLVFCYHAEKRVQAFIDVVKKTGLTLLLPPAELAKWDHLESQCQYLLKSGCNAIIGINSNSIIAILEYVYKQGRGMPKEVKLGGIDEVPLVHMLAPELLMLRQPTEQYAAKIVEILLYKMQEKEISKNNKKFLFKGKLVGN